MKNGLEKISCDPLCGFMIQSHDHNELLDLTMRHVKNAHPDIKTTMKEVEARVMPA